MTLLERFASAKAAGLTFFANFWPWLLAAFLLGASISGLAGYKLAKLIYQGEAQDAKLQLAGFEKSLAESNAMGEAEAARRHTEAMDKLADRDKAVNAALAAIPEQIARELAPKFNQIRESLNAPEYNCFRLPFPPPALRLLERPGGSAAQGDGHPEARGTP